MNRRERAARFDAEELAGALATESCMDPAWRRRINERSDLDRQQASDPPFGDAA